MDRTIMEYATATEPSGNDGAVRAMLTAMASEGWRLVTYDGSRYIFERPRQDTDIRER